MLHNKTIRPTPRHRLRLPLRQLPAMDLPFLVLVLTLVGFGLVMLASASSAVALYRRGDAWAYLRPQLLYAALGLVGLWLASRVDYHIFHKLAWPLLALSLVLLVAVLFMPEYNGCKRWLVLPGLGTLQPSEIAKFAVVLVFSHVISLNHDQMKRFSVGVLPFALVLGVVAALMLLEPHLSGTLLILGIGAVLMFVGGTGLQWFALAGGMGAAAIAANSFAVTAESLCYMPGYGIGDAATTLIGQSVGARRADLCRSFAKMTVTTGMIVMALMGVVMYVFAPEMIGLLSPVDEIRTLGTEVLRIEAFAEPFFAAAIVSYSVCVGAGDTCLLYISPSPRDS